MQEQTKDLSIGQALDLGCELARAGQHDQAVGLFRGVLMHEPKNFEAFERLGSSLFEMGRHHEALFYFWRGLKLDRRHPMALTNYGLCLSQLGYAQEALPDLERAAKLAARDNACPASVKSLVYNNLGNTLERMNRHHEALAALDRGIAYDPNEPFAHYNRGIVLLRLNRQRDGIEALDRSLALRPVMEDSASRLNAADAFYNRGMGRLLLGDIKGGFEDYEYRLLTTENRLPNLGLPAERKWKKGEPIEGKTVLVLCEQGLGDDIQFLRFLQPLHDRANPGHIKLCTHRGTAPLLNPDLPITLLAAGDKLDGAYDCWIPLMSLPFMLGVDTEADFPPPYVPMIENERGEKWRRAFGLSYPLDRKLKVGICWAGNWQHKNDHHRSIPVKMFHQMFSVGHCNFVSLQQLRPEDHEPAARALLGNIPCPEFDDFRDTAAAILNMDVVVTVDTAVAHLAASLGVPTWILIPKYGTDWRWQLERTDSPWYPSAKLYRQKTIGDWKSVIAKVRDDLEALALATPTPDPQKQET